MASARPRRGLKAKTGSNINREPTISPKPNGSHKNKRIGKVKLENTPPPKSKIKARRRLDKQHSSFPRPDPIKNAFCCSSIMETTHKANTEPHAYSIEILGFMNLMKCSHDEEAIIVMDTAWQGLLGASFILELKEGIITQEECMATRSKTKNERAKEGDAKVELEEDTIEWGLGRYFAPAGAGVGDFVELLITDGRVPREFDNVLGVCKELLCDEHKGKVFQIEIWEGMAAKDEYLRKYLQK